MPLCWPRTLPPRTPLRKSYYCVLRIAQIRSCASSEASRSDGRRCFTGSGPNFECHRSFRVTFGICGPFSEAPGVSRTGTPRPGAFRIKQAAAGHSRKTWTAHRVSSLRRVRGIHAYRSAEKNGEWLTMSEAAAKLGVSNHQIRRLIKEGVLAADQVVPDAPYQIRAADLQHERISAALARKGRPCRLTSEKQTSMFSDT